MLSTGDLQGSLRKLETLLRVIKYPGNVDYNSLSRGDPSAFLPMVSYTLTSFSPAFTEQLMAAGLELTGKTDLRFTDTLYKVLRDIFYYKPVLTKQQFLQWGFSQRKISIACDIINLVLQKHNKLKKPSVRCLAPNKGSKENIQQTLTEALAVSDQLVINHTESHSTFHLNSPHMETLSSSSPENRTTQPAGDEEEVVEQEEGQKDLLHSAEVDRRLSALENKLQGLQAGLAKFRVLEKHLEDQERKAPTEKSQSDMVVVSRESWESLMSRVLLLETKMELRDTLVHRNQPSVQTDSSQVDEHLQSAEEH